MLNTSTCSLILTWFKALASCLSFSQEDFASGKRPFLKILMDAGAAANAAAIQLMSFKDVMDDEFPVCLFQLHTSSWVQIWTWLLIASQIYYYYYYSFSRVIKDPRSSASDKHRITRQRRLLLEKLEDFGRINKLLRQKLKQLQISEVGYLCILLRKVSCGRHSKEQMKP